jgi:phosphomethylpyrimidine synthase
MNAQLMQVVSESLPASRKIHRPGRLHAGLRVPLRAIELHPSAGEPPLTVYDSSGPYTDPSVTIDIAQGLPRTRASWINARGDTEAYPGRHVQPLDDGLVPRTAASLRRSGGHAARVCACRNHHARDGIRRDP